MSIPVIQTTQHTTGTRPRLWQQPAISLRAFSGLEMISVLRHMQFTLPIIVLSLGQTLLQADEIPWEAIADDAAVIVRLKDPQRAIKQYGEIATRVSSGGVEHAGVLASSLGEMLLNPKLAGIDRDSSWCIAIYVTDLETMPGVVYIIPAADKKKLREAVGENTRFLEHGKYSVYSPDFAAAEKTASRLTGEGRSIRDVIDRESCELFDRGQLSVFINVPPLLRALRQQNDAGGVDAKNSRKGGELNAPKPAHEPNGDREFIEMMTRAGENTQSVVLAAGVSDAGITIDGMARLRPGSPAAKLLPKSAAAPFPKLAALPAGQNVYVGVAGDVLNLLRASSESWQGDTDKLRKPKPELVAAEAELGKLRLDTLVYSTKFIHLGAAIDETLVISMNETQSFRDLRRKIAVARNGADTAAFRWEVELNTAAERYGDTTADIATWRRTFRKRAASGMLAKDWTTRSVYLANQVAETTGGGREAMEHVLAALASDSRDLPEDSPFQQTRSRLDADADVIVLFDAPKVCFTIGEAIGQALAHLIFQQITLGLLPGEVQTHGGNLLEKLDLADSYCGLSAVVQRDGVRVRVFVPLEQIEGFVQIAQAVDARAEAANDNNKDDDNVVDEDDPKEAAAERVTETRLDVEDFDRHVFGGAESEWPERSRKLFEIILGLKVSSFEWPCGLADAQKRKIQLAGRGDIERSFARVDEHRQRFDSLAKSEQDDDCWSRQMKESGSAKAIIESDPFGDGSLFVKTLVHSLTADQFPKYEAVRAILRAGGRVRTRSSGSEPLREIDLRVTRFSDAGLDLLGRIKDVQILNLESTRVTDAGLGQLQGLSDLEELDLGDTRVTDAGLVQLQCLKKLRKLNLMSTQAGDATLLGLKGLTKLRHLGLFGTNISDRGLEMLPNLKNLEVLNLGATQISDAGLLNLRPQAAVRLKELNLQGTQITDFGLRTVARLKNLEVLELRNTRVTDVGLGYLRKLTCLNELYLAGTDVSDSAVADFNRMLPEVKTYK